MSHQYHTLVEAVADKMIEGGTERVPFDSLERAASMGFEVRTFEADVEAEVASRNAPADPRQTTLSF